MLTLSLPPSDLSLLLSALRCAETQNRLWAERAPPSAALASLSQADEYARLNILLSHILTSTEEIHHESHSLLP
jgi:hypothetical protein